MGYALIVCAIALVVGIALALAILTAAAWTADRALINVDAYRRRFPSPRPRGPERFARRMLYQTKKWLARAGWGSPPAPPAQPPISSPQWQPGPGWGSPPALDTHLPISSPQWQPRPGWGTVRHLSIQTTDSGELEAAFVIVPDDSTEPKPCRVDPHSLPELGEFARVVFSPDEITIRVSPPALTKAESLFEQINHFDSGKRAEMHADDNGLAADCGWTWTDDHYVVRAAPGILH